MNTIKWAIIGGGVIGFLILFDQHKRELRKNADGPSDTAVKGYEAFQWGKKPDKVLEVEAPAANGHLFELGKVAQVNYLASKNEGKDTVEAEYYHRFDGELPTLASDEHGKLFIVGGSYDITERGIVG